MTAPRFIVTEFEGYPIVATNRGGGGSRKVTFYVQDTLYLYAVVATFEYTPRSYRTTHARNRRAAERECARLNASWEAEPVRG